RSSSWTGADGEHMVRSMALTGIAGKVALVTGTARRRSIGRATALRLAEEGADVACLDVARPPAHAPAHGVGSPDELFELIAEIEGMGRRALRLEADVRDWDAMHAAVDQTVTEL